jgi:DNA-binding NarL/FixJ family response regulator
MTTAEGPRILLVDDDERLRTALRMLLDIAGLEVVGEAGDGASGVAAVRELRPDIVLMDVRMPGMDGLEATRRITAMGLGVAVIVVSAYDTSAFEEQARNAGAAELVAKGVSPSLILRAIDRAWRALPSGAPNQPRDVTALTGILKRD